MLAWFTANTGTILITLLLIVIVAVIIVKLLKDKKKGVSSCGGNCAHCVMSGNCHQQKASVPAVPPGGRNRFK